MAQTSNTPEVDAINDAFHDRMCLLFGVLVGNLVDTADVHGGEQKSIERFSKGLGFTRRARELALEAVKVLPQAQAAAKGEVDQA
jgi:hypothetical protein